MSFLAVLSVIGSLDQPSLSFAFLYISLCFLPSSLITLIMAYLLRPPRPHLSLFQFPYLNTCICLVWVLVVLISFTSGYLCSRNIVSTFDSGKIQSHTLQYIFNDTNHTLPATPQTTPMQPKHVPLGTQWVWDGSLLSSVYGLYQGVYFWSQLCAWSCNCGIRNLLPSTVRQCHIIPPSKVLHLDLASIWTSRMKTATYFPLFPTH